MRILVTGATGFLGSHIAEALLKDKHLLILTKRESSDLWRCASFVDRCKWTTIDNENWEDDIRNFNPSVIINAAWDGVSANFRENWIPQLSNLFFQQKLLSIASETDVELIIGIGSQAEYGEFNGCVDELYPTNPTSAYGTVKLCALNILKTFCEQNNIRWYWFRLFSCFGERESENWLIPSTIKKMLTTDNMDLTSGEQKYSYLYIKDVARLFSIAINSFAENGVYNISSTTQRSLKEVLNLIREYINPSFNLNWGSLPYRKGQSMLNGGDMRKTNNAFHCMEGHNWEQNLYKTIEYYKNKYSLNNDR
jgi:nucleoside-diphosphate-sugar epimerase